MVIYHMAWGKNEFTVKFDHEGLGQSPHKTIRISTKEFCTSVQIWWSQIEPVDYGMDKLRVDCNTQAQMYSHTDGHRRWQWQYLKVNKANLRDLIAATGLVISNWIQIVNFSARVTVKFDGWPRKIIGHLFYATASFVHHFVPIDEFKLELQSGNAQSGSNSTIFRAVRPWNLTDDLAKQ